MVQKLQWFKYNTVYTSKEEYCCLKQLLQPQVTETNGYQAINCTTRDILLLHVTALLVDLGGAAGARLHSQWDPILSFSHIFPPKNTCVGGRRPPQREILDPQLCTLVYKEPMNLTEHFQSFGSAGYIFSSDFNNDFMADFCTRETSKNPLSGA